MNPAWPKISPGIYYDNSPAAIEWLCRTFGFSVRLKVEDPGGDIAHSELTMGDGLIMVGSAKSKPGRASPRTIGGANTQGLMVYVDDVDAHCNKARAAGAKILQDPMTMDYGAEHWSDRYYEAEDCEGHRWWFAQRIRNRQQGTA